MWFFDGRNFNSHGFQHVVKTHPIDSFTILDLYIVAEVSIGINQSCVFVVDADGNRQRIESAKDVIPDLFVVAENREEISKLALEITDLSQSFTFRRS